MAEEANTSSTDQGHFAIRTFSASWAAPGDKLSGIRNYWEWRLEIWDGGLENIALKFSFLQSLGS